MTPEEWLQLSPLLDELLELSPEQREERLAVIAEQHSDQAEELRRLLALEEATPDFMARPIMEGVEVTPEEGDLIGPYRLEQLVGEGGMGQVWQASRADGLYERRVALKLLRPGYADPGLRSRFHRERQILARLGHANIARLLDAGASEDGRPYLAIEFINGESITRYAERLQLDTVDRLRLFVQVCGAVSHAHANLVVHRDLKPSNILVTPAGDVRLLDFGIAKLLDTERGEHTQLTRAESRPFTLHYAAPEQIRGEPITTMTDVYALGVVLYELLTGHPPYVLRRDSDAGWEEAILEDEPLRPSLAVLREAGRDLSRRRLARRLSGDLDNIVLKALRKAPEQRYPSAEALCQDLVRHLEGRPVGARSHSLHYRLGKFAGRHALALGTALVVMTMLALGLAAVHLQTQHAMVEARRAQAMQDFVVALFETSGRNSDGGNVDLRRLLGEGVRRAGFELSAQHQARAELLGLIARLYNGLGNHGEALAVLDQQQAAIESLGPDAPLALRLESTVQRGRALRLQGHPRECASTLEPVLAELSPFAMRDAVPGAELHSQLGRCQEQVGRQQEARTHFQRALELRRARGVDDAEALADLARLDRRAGRPASALQQLEQAMQSMRAAGSERSAQSTLVWQHKGQTHLQLGNLLRAEGDGRQALEDALLHFGALHPLTLGVQRHLAEVALEMGDLGHARRLAELNVRELGARYAERRVDLAEARLLLARVAAAEGQFSEAGELLQRVQQGLSGDAGILLRPDAQVLQARVLFERGDLRRAQLLAEVALAEVESIYGPRHPLHLEIRRLRAEVLASLGDLDAAEQELDKALAVLDVGSDAHPAVGRVRITQLRIDAERGDFELAGRRLDELLQTFPDDDPGRASLHWQLRALEAELQCGQGRVDEGLAALDELEANARASEGGLRGGWQHLLVRAHRRCDGLAGDGSFVALR